MTHRIVVTLALALGFGLVQAQEAAQAPAAAVSSEATDSTRQTLLAEIAKVEEPAMLTQLVARFRQQGDLEAELAALDRRIALRPHMGAYRLDKVVTLAREDRKSEAYTLLIDLQNTGYAYDLRGDERFANIATTQVWDYIVDNFDANRAPYGEGTVLHTLPREDLLIESVGWDASRKQLLVGGAREGKVYRVEKDGKLVPLVSADADNGMWAVLDFVVDAKRGFLWVASSAVPHFKGYKPGVDVGRAGIFKFDLKTGKFIRSFLSPEGQGNIFMLASLALGVDGEIYALDIINSALYQVRDDQFRRLVHAPAFPAMRALTVSGDGKNLYLADYERGIVGIELATLKAFDVRVPTKLSLQGIEALFWFEGSLVAVQSGMTPPRVMRFGLSDDGRTITGVTPVEASNPAFAKVGKAAMDGSSIYVVGNSQLDNYDRFGLVRNKDQLEGTRIIRIDADYVPPQAQ
ncbi:MAG: hypothetical protein WDA70_07480 [Lysobacteraceae bacterium]